MKKVTLIEYSRIEIQLWKWQTDSWCITKGWTSLFCPV